MTSAGLHEVNVQSKYRMLAEFSSLTLGHLDTILAFFINIKGQTKVHHPITMHECGKKKEGEERKREGEGRGKERKTSMKQTKAS